MMDPETESNTEEEKTARADSGSRSPTRGAERLDRSHRQRELQRRMLRVAPTVLQLIGLGREVLRKVAGRRHTIDFFHQVDDAYSHLALEAIGPLLERYDVDFRFHLTSQTDRLHAPEPELLTEYARRDCALVAPHYGLEFPSDAKRPSTTHVSQVEAMLANLTSDPRFLEVALRAGRALWSSNTADLEQLASLVPLASGRESAAALSAGNELRTKRRHYSGAMFWYAGEWYWGVDRIYHLENRLSRLGASKSSAKKIRFERPPLDAGNIQNEGRLTLEFFPSLRSPYTAMIFERSVALAESVGVPVTIRPVMPMVMRGVPAPAAKGIYIMLDTLREANHIGAPFGNMYDPIGEAVERGFAIWPYARDQGRGAEFIASFLRAAFVLGQPTGTEEGLARVVEDAGLTYAEARPYLDQESWRDELESNRETMYGELGLWGVPSYRLREVGKPDLSVWGQDRLWLIAAEIRKRLASA